MKPTVQITGHAENERTEGRRAPLTDYNYHSTKLDSFGAPCAKIASVGFYTLSHEYFNTEANRYFVAEAGVFTAILAMAALPLLQGAYAVLHLVSTIGA